MKTPYSEIPQKMGAPNPWFQRVFLGWERKKLKIRFFANCSLILPFCWPIFLLFSSYRGLSILWLADAVDPLKNLLFKSAQYFCRLLA